MAVDNNSLRDPQRISSIEELEAAKKKAAINASQDRLLLTNNLGKIKEGGPAVLLQNVVLPVAAVGAGLWVTSKVVSAIFSGSDDDEFDDERHYYSVPPPPAHAGATAYAPPPPPPRRRPAIKQVATYLPIAIKLAKMGVSYLEKNGTAVPPVIHTLLSGPGVSSRQKA